MTFVVEFRVAAWALWHVGGVGLMRGGASLPERAMPSSLRRRVTDIGRKALETAWMVLPAADVAAPPRIILSSRHGEYARTKGLLEELTSTGEISPADFSLSVHHALAGLLSIATCNREGHCAVAGGADSFGYGLLESVGAAAEGTGSAMLMHFDEPLPDCYAGIADFPESAIAMALLIRPADRGAGLRVRMGCQIASEPGRGGLAHEFVRLIGGACEATSATGERMNWWWNRVVTT